MSVCGGSQDVTGVLVLLRHFNGSYSGNLWLCDVELCAQSALVTTLRWGGWLTAGSQLCRHYQMT